MSNSTHYRGTGVGATIDNKNKLDSGNLSNYGNDTNETNDSVGAMLPLVQTLALNESNMAAAYGGISNGNNANSIAGESSDNGGRFFFIFNFYFKKIFHSLFTKQVFNRIP